MLTLMSAKTAIFELISTIDLLGDGTQVLSLVNGARCRLIILIHFECPTLAVRNGIATILSEQALVLVILVWYVFEIVTIAFLDAYKAACLFNGIVGHAFGDLVRLRLIMVHSRGVFAQEVQLELGEVGLLRLGCQRVARRSLFIRICDFT